MHVAARAVAWQSLACLLELGVPPVVTNKQRETPLHVLAQRVTSVRKRALEDEFPVATVTERMRNGLPQPAADWRVVAAVDKFLAIRAVGDERTPPAFLWAVDACDERRESTSTGQPPSGSSMARVACARGDVVDA